MAGFQQEPTAQDENPDIVVRAVSTFRPEESDLSHATDKKYVFSYAIEIENRTPRTIQLLARHWWITDARQEVREVEGEGVLAALEERRDLGIRILFSHEEGVDFPAEHVLAEELEARRIHPNQPAFPRAVWER